MPKTPYLEVVDEPRMMKGKGAPRSTVFGVLGRTREEPMAKSLGGLVHHTADAPVKKGTISRKHEMTERNIEGNVSKTKTNGLHYGQVLYPGVFMGHAGQRL